MCRTNVSSKVSLVLLIGLVAGYSGQPIVQDDYCPIRFAVIGDRAGTPVQGIYEQIVKEVQMLKPDFVLTVGDQIEGSSDTILLKRAWEEIKSFYASLTMPVHITPGNNDIWNSVSLEYYKRYVGPPYYSFDVKDVHFVVIDNSLSDVDSIFVREQKEQIAWLLKDLSDNAKAHYTFVFSHKPYWIEMRAAGKNDTLHNIFVKYGVGAVFTGHYHDYFSGSYDGVFYTGVGSSGGACVPGPTGLQYHFVWVTVDKEGISIAPIALGGVKPWDELTGAEYRFVNRIKKEAMILDKPPVNINVAVPETQIKVKIVNLSEQITLEDTLRWQIPDDWHITPSYLPVKVEPNKIYEADFTVRSTGALYPTPTLFIQYPYALGKKFKLERYLQVTRTACAYATKKPLIIDGKLNEKIWKNPVRLLFRPDGSPMITDPVDFYFAWDKANLYIAAKCTEMKMDSIFAAATEHDGTVYSEDCIGFFFQSDTNDGPVYQIYFNPLGTSFDQKINVKNKKAFDSDRKWNGKYEVKTFNGNDYWSIEARIPLDQLGATGEKGKTWAVNFRRKQKRLDSASDWQVPVSYDPEDFGMLIMK